LKNIGTAGINHAILDVQNKTAIRRTAFGEYALLIICWLLKLQSQYLRR
jgi:hypothetical protein